MLPSGWIYEKHIDLEYQSYLLLSYLKTVAESFGQSKLYPFFPELIFHQKNLLHLKNEKQILAAKFPKDLSGIDFSEKKLKYKYLLRDDEKMEELNSIVEYSLPKIEHYIDEGNSIFQLVKESLNISPVGIIPVYAKEGYLFLSTMVNSRKRASIFQYRFSLFTSELSSAAADTNPGPGMDLGPFLYNIQTQYIATSTISSANTFENIKIRLVKNKPELPNPATFAIESELSFPVKETLLPVAKKILVSYVIELLPPSNPKGASSKEKK